MQKSLIDLHLLQSHASQVLGFKFQYYQRLEVNSPVPFGLYKLTALLVKEDFIDLDSMWVFLCLLWHLIGKPYCLLSFLYLDSSMDNVTSWNTWNSNVSASVRQTRHPWPVFSFSKDECSLASLIPRGNHGHYQDLWFSVVRHYHHGPYVWIGFSMDSVVLIITFVSR